MIDRGLTPRAALEEAILTALRRPPCVVSFSGGRDSSTVLALATSVARREGLDPPVPVTLRFPGAPAADESAWQESVIDHLGLEDWERLDLADELDLVGPVAAAALRRHGLLWPPNTHFHRPILEHAAGGAVLTGIDGDGLLASWRWQRLARVLSGKVRPRARDLGWLVLASVPPAARRAVEQRRPVMVLRWLRPEAIAALHRLRVSEISHEPARWDRWVPWYAGQRSLGLVRSNFERLAADADVMATHPFADATFLATLASAGGRRGPGNRTEVMERLAGDLLPPDVLRRRSKASLNGAFWRRPSREFAASWDGTGVDTSLVDVDALRQEWLTISPHACSSTLLQAAWLAASPAADAC